MQQQHNERLDTIARWWAEHHIDTIEYLDTHGAGEPVCFRCGWLPPIADTPAPRDPWRAWKRATGWLEAAHLADHAALKDAGKLHTDGPHNQVPLCYWCHHREMPDHDDRDVALEWVLNAPHRPWQRQYVTDTLGHLGRLPAGLGKASRLARKVDRILAASMVEFDRGPGLARVAG